MAVLPWLLASWLTAAVTGEEDHMRTMVNEARKRLEGRLPEEEFPAHFRPWATHNGCAELIKRFDFNANISSLAFKHFHACVNLRSSLPDWRSLRRPSLLSGEHYPVTITPSPMSPPGYWLTPPWDYVVSNYVRRDGTFEVAELALFNQLVRKGQTVCDIGAHIGAYTVSLAAGVGETGTVYSFEPFRLVYQMMIANVAINGLSNVHGHNMALGEREETRRLRSPAVTKSSNMGATRIWDQVEEHMTTEHVLQYEGEEDVKVSLLDNFHFERLDFIKIDVEGMVDAVLRGGQRTIKHHRPLIATEILDEDQFIPTMMSDLQYRCVSVLEVHDLWVCVPSERWWRYKWLDKNSQAAEEPAEDLGTTRPEQQSPPEAPSLMESILGGT